jgi:diguanylate cyclase (GGDEF)-like protein/PAS domain S-box-containing protein
VSEERIARAARDAALTTLLASRRQTVVAATAEDGFRVELPASLDVAGHQALPVPAARATILDVVVPADRIAVVATWERARRAGMAACAVHAASDPRRRLSLSIVDVRHSHGVYVAVLSEDADAPAEGGELLAAALVVSVRPRTATMRKGMTAIITAVDDHAVGMLGWTPDQMVGLRSTEFIHPDDQERAIAGWLSLLSHRRTERVRVRHRCADGGWLWVELEHIHNGAEDPDDVDVVARISDISEEMAAHEAVARREQLFSRLAESLPTGVLQLGRDRSVVYANARLRAILGVEAPGDADTVLAAVAREDRPAAQEALAAVLERGEDRALEVEVRRPRTLERLRCALTLAAIDDQEGEPGALVCFTDVTNGTRPRDELEVRATFDALTGARNRASIVDALECSLAAGARGTAVILVDLDRFKPVNDSLGHAAGDELLVHVATRLHELLRGDDLVGRLGGDEFLVVCRGVERPWQAAAIADRVRDALNGAVALSTGASEVCASIGVAHAQPGMSAEELIARADVARYESKRRGGGEPVLAQPA